MVRAKTLIIKYDERKKLDPTCMATCKSQEITRNLLNFQAKSVAAANVTQHIRWCTTTS